MNIKFPFDTGNRIFIGLGAETNTTLCHADGKTAEISKPYTDLRDAGILEAFERDLSNIINEAREFTLACDLHPQYVTTAVAEKLAPDPDKIVRVQHHHAHIASVMAERGLGREVIGLAFDGTGYGSDGAVWGMEFLIASPLDYRRAGHLAYAPMPGGDMAVREPYRMAISHLYRSFGNTLGCMREMYEKLFGIEKVMAIIEMAGRGINSPPTSSCGRLFDAVGSILGVCHLSKGRAEGPRGLEDMADRRETGSYGFTIGHDGDMRILDLAGAFDELSEDLKKGTDPSVVSARFHNTVGCAAADMAYAVSEETGIKKVVLSGGVFANKLLRERTVARLEGSGLDPVAPERVSVTDAGISLGQVYVAINQVI